MDLRQVEYVLAVVDHGSFTAAASSIPVSQPALSQGIRALERSLGVELFHRIGRRVVLTEAGHAFVAPARQLLADRSLAIEAIGAVRGLHAGRLDIVSLPTLSVSPLVELVTAFRSRHPGVGLRIHEHDGSTGDALSPVRDGRCEVGLVELPDHESLDGLVALPLKSQEFLAVCPPGTALGRRRCISVHDLADLPIATTPEGTSSRRLLDDAFTTAGVEPPPPAVVSTHRELLAPLVLAGAAATLLPSPMAAEAAARGAVVAPLDPPLRRTIGLVHRSGVVSPAASEFCELAVNAQATANPAAISPAARRSRATSDGGRRAR